MNTNTKVLLTLIVILIMAIVSTGCTSKLHASDSANNTQTWYVRSAERDMQNNTTILMIKSVNSEAKPTSFKPDDATIITSNTQYDVKSICYYTQSTNGAPKPGGSKYVFMSFDTSDNISDAYLTVRGTEYDHTANTASPTLVNVSLANVTVNNASLTDLSIMDMFFNVSNY